MDTSKPRVWTVALALLVAFATVFVASGMLLLALGARAGAPITDAKALEAVARDPANTSFFVVTQAGIFLLVAVFVALLALSSFAARLGLGRSRIRGRRGAALFAVSAVGAIASGAFVTQLWIALSGGASPTIKRIDAALKATASEDVALIAFAATLLAPLGEELFFRGIVQTRLVARFGAWIGIGAASVFFALAHFDWMHSSVVLAISAFVGLVAYRTGTTRSALFAHVVNNVFAFFLARTVGDITVTSATRLAMSAGYFAIAVLSVVAVLRLSRSGAS